MLSFPSNSQRNCRYPIIPRCHSVNANFFLFLQNFLNDICILLIGATSVNDSLFIYEEGEDHSTYFDAGYVPIFLDKDDLVFDNVTLGKQARDACADNKQCLFDIFTTGKVSIGMASKQAVESFIAVVNETETAGE